MIYALDRAPQALAPVVEPLSRRFFRHQLVFLHTSLDFRPFMDAHAAFEALPPLDQIAAFPTLTDWPAYLGERRALLVTKWAPRRAISYGMAFDDYLAEARRITCADE